MKSPQPIIAASEKLDAVKQEPKKGVSEVVKELIDSSRGEAATILGHMVKSAVDRGSLDSVPVPVVLWYLQDRVLWLIQGEMRAAPRDVRWAIARDITLLMHYIRNDDSVFDDEAAEQVYRTCHRFLVQRRAWAAIEGEDLSYGGAIPSPAAKAVRTLAEYDQLAGRHA